MIKFRLHIDCSVNNVDENKRGEKMNSTFPVVQVKINDPFKSQETGENYLRNKTSFCLGIKVKWCKMVSSFPDSLTMLGSKTQDE